MNRLTKVVTVTVAAILSSCGGDPLPTAERSSMLISNVVIIDGSGSARQRGAVRIEGGSIIDVGELEPLPGEPNRDGGGLVLAPGFIDTHSHADDELFDRPDALAAVSQGITTVVIGMDGSSPLPLLEFRFRMLDNPVAVNVASYSGHNTIRRRVMGDEFRRPATQPELNVMSQFLREDLQAGALGLSTGLEYDPGIYSETDEIVALATIAAEYGGRYVSHVRSEDRWFEQAIDELVEIGRSANIPVQIAHIKLAMTSLWGRAGDIIAKLDAARAEGVDVTADLYPYEYWQSNMLVLLPERDIDDRAQVELALSEIAPPDGIWFTQYDPQPEYVGLTLTEIAEQRGSDPVTIFMELIVASEAMTAETGAGADTIIGTSMREEDIRVLMAWPHTNICTDGSLADLHPRGMGSFTRVLGRYVREGGLMTLEEAVHKMTGLSARHVGFEDRGLIRSGAAADLVLFDPDAVIDNATPDEPYRLSSGIVTVWVNGQVVFESGDGTGARPGRFLARGPSQD